MFKLVPGYLLLALMAFGSTGHARESFPGEIRRDIRLGYDLSDGNTNYTYGLVANTTLPTPVQYGTQPKNRLDVARVDVQYYIRQNLALGAAYWYENWKVQDFALDPAIINTLIVRNPTSNALTGFYTGYANEPYKANTFFVRMSYLW